MKSSTGDILIWIIDLDYDTQETDNKVNKRTEDKPDLI